MTERSRDSRFAVLRQQAQQVLARQSDDIGQLSNTEVRELLQELRIHQIELQLQNDELLRARHEAEAERNRFAELYHSIPVGCLTVDRQGMILEANQTSHAMLSAPPGDLGGRMLSDFLLAEDQDALFLFMRRVFKASEVQQGELRFRRLDGSQFTASIEAKATSTDTGDTCRVVLSDITMRKQAEEVLQQRDWLDVTLSSIGDAVIATDTRGVITFLNRVAEDLTGWTASEAVGRPVDEVLRIIHEQTQQPLNSPVARVLQEKRVSRLAPRTVLITHDGREVAIADSCAPIRHSGGKFQGAVVVFRDVSEHRRMEDEMLRARKVESVGVLAGGIAHDFNNLLTGILGNISLAKEFAEPNEQVEKRLKEAEKACQRATALTHQLLTFAKGGAPVRQTVSLTELLHESMAFAFHGSNVRADLSIAEDLWSVDVDTGQIHQVLHNVLLNAAQAMPQGGAVEVQAANVLLGEEELPPLAEGRYVNITVRDEGCGIPADVLPNLFDPYFTTKGDGRGLGLATAYAIVNKHHGSITVASEEGIGTTFCIYLPASQHAIESRQKGPETSMAGSGKLLVVDDEAYIRDVLCEMLHSLGYEVDCTHNGAEAIGLYQKAIDAAQPYAAVILDNTIPGGMGGREILERLRAVDPQIKAIISSGYANDPVMANYTQYGFTGVVAKPYTMQRLQDALQRVLHGGHGNPTSRQTS